MWAFQDATPRIVADTSVAHGGAASLRIDGGAGNARVNSLAIAVQPWRQFHVRFFARTLLLSGRSDVRVMDASTLADGHFYKSQSFPYQPTQDWTRYDFVFSSGASTAIQFWIGFWSTSSGSLWLDDVSIEETASVNLLRRAGAPLRVYDAAADCIEGRDFDPVSDPNAATNGLFLAWHVPPVLTSRPAVG